MVTPACGIAIPVAVDDGCCPRAIESVARRCYTPVIIVRLKAAGECYRIGGNFLMGPSSEYSGEVVGTWHRTGQRMQVWM
jgi:hypothetical protein